MTLNLEQIGNLILDLERISARKSELREHLVAERAKIDQQLALLGELPEKLKELSRDQRNVGRDAEAKAGVMMQASARSILPCCHEVTLEDCPPGPFLFEGALCFKSEYFSRGGCDAYNSAGEYFCGDRRTTLVQPCN